MTNPQGHAFTDGQQPGFIVPRESVPVSAYSIFVHASPIYNTSELLTKRSSRPGSRPHGRPNRILPLRPDGYPYANRRWSRRLNMPINLATGGEAA